MAQYKTGTVSVTNGSAVVNGTGTSWLANVSAGDGFTVVGTGVNYTVASVDGDGQITLSTNYAGATASGVNYTVWRDFTTENNIPELSQGDIETATVFTRAMRLIDGFLKQNSEATGSAQTDIQALEDKNAREAIFKRATLNFNYTTNTYEIYEGAVGHLTARPFDDVHTFVRGSAALATGPVKLEEVANDVRRLEKIAGGLLVEEERQTVAQYARHILQGYWNEIVDVSVVPYAGIAPDGTLTAFQMTADASSGRLTKSTGDLSAGNDNALSWYFKHVSGTGRVQLRMRTLYSDFDIINGEVVSSDGESEIEALPNGWYRCKFVDNPSTDSRYGFDFDTGSAGDVILAWHPQLEYASKVSSPIVPDTQFVSRDGPATYYDSNGVLQTAAVDEARDDAYGWFNGVLYRIGLLLEGASENLVLDNRDPNQASWTKAGSVVVARDQIGLDGVANSAFTLTDTSASSFEFIQQEYTIADDTAVYAESFFVKKQTSVNVGLALSFVGSDTKNHQINFNAETGEWGYRSSQEATARIDVVDQKDWWRVTIVEANTGTGNTTLRLQALPAVGTTLTSWNANVTGSAVFDFIGLEANDYATSPIETAGSTITRAADASTSPQATREGDICYRTLGQEFNRAGFTVYGEVTLDSLTANGRLTEVSSENTNDYVAVYVRGDGNLGALVRFNSTNEAVIDSGALLLVDVPFKYAIAFSKTGATLAINGSSASAGYTLTDADVARLKTLFIGTEVSQDRWANGRYKKKRLLPEALSASDLELITGGA